MLYTELKILTISDMVHFVSTWSFFAGPVTIIKGTMAFYI